MSSRTADMADEKTTTDTVVVRPRRVVWMSAALAVVLLAVFVTVAVLLRSEDTGAIFMLSDQIAMVGVGVMMAGAAMLFATPVARADAKGVYVRNIGVSRRFTWDEVIAVSFPDGAAFARIELPDYEYYSIMAIQGVDRERAVEGVRALRRLHSAARRGDG